MKTRSALAATWLRRSSGKQKSAMENCFSLTLLQTILPGLAILKCQSSSLDIDEPTNLLDEKIHSMPVIV